MEFTTWNQSGFISVEILTYILTYIGFYGVDEFMEFMESAIAETDLSTLPVFRARGCDLGSCVGV